ncbi:MAG: hypothetical protein RL033_5418, partial [Pseudomonadota bacterium]
AFADVTAAADPKRLPDVWIVAIGISRYAYQPQLPAAHEDARSIAQAFSQMSPQSFATAHVRTLLNEDASPEAIRGALAELSQMKRDDVAVVFLAGHGFKVNDKEMVFATGGIGLDPGRSIGLASNHSVSWSDMGAALRKASGRVLVLLDACHSGDVTQDLVVPNEALAEALTREGRAGAVVFAAAKGRQESIERNAAGAAARRGLGLSTDAVPLLPTIGAESSGGHGVFTAALLAALHDPITDVDKDGVLQLSEVVAEVTRRVALATGGRQTPFVPHDELLGDWGLARTPKGSSN